MLRTHATSEVTHKWFEYGLNTYQERGPRRDDFRQGDLRRSQERSRGGAGEVQRAAREDRTSAPGPKRGSKRATKSPRKEHRRVPRGDPRGLDHCPKMLPREPWEVPPKGGRGSKRTPKPRPTGPLRSALRSAQRKAEEGSGRAPRVAPECPQEELQEGPKRPQQERQNGTQKSTTAPGGLQQGTKQLPNMASRGGPERSKMVQYCAKVGPNMA